MLIINYAPDLDIAIPTKKQQQADPASQQIKADLIQASFNAHVMLTTDVGSKRIAPM